jgi:hypothetical protein
VRSRDRPGLVTALYHFALIVWPIPEAIGFKHIALGACQSYAAVPRRRDRGNTTSRPRNRWAISLLDTLHVHIARLSHLGSLDTSTSIRVILFQSDNCLGISFSFEHLCPAAQRPEVLGNSAVREAQITEIVALHPPLSPLLSRCLFYLYLSLLSKARGFQMPDALGIHYQKHLPATSTILSTSTVFCESCCSP